MKYLENKLHTAIESAATGGDRARPEAVAVAPILFVFRGSDRPTLCLQRAAELAQQVDAQLHILHIARGPGALSAFDESERASTQPTHASAAAWLMAILGDQLVGDRLRVASGGLVDSVGAFAAEIGAGLVVVAPPQGRFGTLATTLARTTQLPVLVSRAATSRRAIVAASDLADPEEAVLRRADELGDLIEAEVIVVHNADSPESAATQRATGPMGRFSNRAAVVTSDINPVDAILREARLRDADLIVVGARRRSYFDPLNAPSVAARLVDRAHRSVLITPLDSWPLAPGRLSARRPRQIVQRPSRATMGGYDSIPDLYEDEGPPSSSGVRIAALGWHREVRRELARGLDAVRAARANDADSSAKLDLAVSTIAATVRKQIQAEDIELAPILRTLDAWGPQRIETLKSAHQEERSAVGHTQRATDLLGRAAELESSIKEILHALRWEEKELLDPDLLDDSTIVNTKQGGS